MLRQQANHPPLLSILLAEVQSLDNKVDELRSRISFQRYIRECKLLCFTESGLSLDILSREVLHSSRGQDRKKITFCKKQMWRGKPELEGYVCGGGVSLRWRGMSVVEGYVCGGGVCLW
jgi:hypothetical protein